MAEQGIAMASRLRNEGRETEVIANWSKDTLVHKLARWAAHEMFYDETGGPYTEMVVPSDEIGQWRPVRYMSVTVALRHYGIGDDSFEVPPSDGEMVRVDHNVSAWQESHKVADACFEYFAEELMMSRSYDQLLGQLADEVFHTVFTNRALRCPKDLGQ